MNSPLSLGPTQSVGTRERGKNNLVANLWAAMPYSATYLVSGMKGDAAMGSVRIRCRS